jgi:hypothetical protein
MAKIIDITDKLDFESKPKIVINGDEFIVNNSAVDVLRITPNLNKSNFTAEDFNIFFETLFSKTDREKIAALNLGFVDFTTLIKTAINLVVGIDDEVGETPTPTTT